MVDTEGVTVGGFIVGEGDAGEEGIESIAFAVMMDAVLTDMTDGGRCSADCFGDGRLADLGDGVGAGDLGTGVGAGDGADIGEDTGASSLAGLVRSLFIDTDEVGGDINSNAVSIFELLGESVSPPSLSLFNNDLAGLNGDIFGKSGMDGIADNSNCDLSVLAKLSEYIER